MARRSKRAKSFEIEEVPFEPVSWRNLVGYEEAKSRFKDLLDRDRLPSSILIDGREGSAKRVFLAYLCALVWCDKGQACGVCGSCLSIQSFSHEEVYWLEPENGKNYQLQDAVALQEHLAIKPRHHQSTRGKRIVVVVDCDLFNLQSANRLLKTLEEPPEDSLIMMSSSHSGQLLPTILSRLFRYRIKPPSVEDAVSYLSRELEPGISEAKISSALKMSALSIGAAKYKLETGDNDDEGYQGLVDALFARHPALSIKLVEEHVRKTKLPANELAKRLELILNQYYKVSLGVPRDLSGFTFTGDVARPSLEQLKHWRKFLREVKSLAIRGKIALNAQLIAESWANAGRFK